MSINILRNISQDNHVIDQTIAPPKYVNKRGYCRAGRNQVTVFTPAIERIWEPAPFDAEIVSDSAEDTQPWDIVGINEIGNWKFQQVNLTGTMPVLLPDWLDIFRITNRGPANKGIVKVTKAGEPNNVKVLSLKEKGTSLCAAITIPQSYVGGLYSYKVTSTDPRCRVEMYSRRPGGQFELEEIELMHDSDGRKDYGGGMPTYEPLTYFEARVQTFTNIPVDVVVKFTMHLMAL